MSFEAVHLFTVHGNCLYREHGNNGQKSRQGTRCLSGYCLICHITSYSPTGNFFTLPWRPISLSLTCLISFVRIICGNNISLKVNKWPSGNSFRDSHQSHAELWSRLLSFWPKQHFISQPSWTVPLFFFFVIQTNFQKNNNLISVWILSGLSLYRVSVTWNLEIQ